MDVRGRVRADENPFNNTERRITHVTKAFFRKETKQVGMSTQAIATRFPDHVAEHVEQVANSPATDHSSKSEVVRNLVVAQFEDQ